MMEKLNLIKELSEEALSAPNSFQLFVNTEDSEKEFEPISKKLWEFIPTEGSVPHPRSKNKWLEKYRVANNLLRDLYVNGLGNKANHFRQFFYPYGIEHFYLYDGQGCVSNRQMEWLEEQCEPIFNDIMFNAFLEQSEQGNISNLEFNKLTNILVKLFVSVKKGEE